MMLFSSAACLPSIIAIIHTTFVIQITPPIVCLKSRVGVSRHAITTKIADAARVRVCVAAATSQGSLRARWQHRDRTRSVLPLALNMCLPPPHVWIF